MDYIQKSALLPPLIEETPNSNLGMIVVIPCFDEPKLIDSLVCLSKCTKPSSDVEVIIIINSSEEAENQVIDQNNTSYNSALGFSKQILNSFIKFHPFNLKFPSKHAGVGLARKVGMDEAVRRFEYLNKDGIIICFDADSLCDENYLIEIEKAFLTHPKATGASIYFEHPTAGHEFPTQVYEGIILYELYLRYYCNALKWAGHPFAYQTIGSSMAVTSKVYQAQGGMNKRKAGEDFYFLEKIIPLGNFMDINTTRVIPSPRPSHRVPFGTGKAVNNWLETSSNATYNPLIFKDLKDIFSSLSQLYHHKDLTFYYASCPLSFQAFMSKSEFEVALNELFKNTNSYTSFLLRFFRWFNLFMVLKFVHFCKEQVYPQVKIEEGAKFILNQLNELQNESSPLDLLLSMRRFDRINSK